MVNRRVGAGVEMDRAFRQAIIGLGASRQAIGGMNDRAPGAVRSDDARPAVRSKAMPGLPLLLWLKPSLPKYQHSIATVLRPVCRYGARSTES